MKPPAAKPVPFNPNLVAPMGSLGDDFDGRIPTETSGAPKPPAQAKPRSRQRPVAKVKAPVLAFATVPLVMMAVAILAQPLGQEKRSLLAFAAVLLAVLYLILLNTKFRGARGAWRNYLALALAVPFLAVPEREHLDRPIRQAYLATVQPILHSNSEQLNQTPSSGLAQRRESWALGIRVAHQHMREAGELAGQIIVECSPEKTLLVGANPLISNSPQWAFYDFVPTINFADECTKAFLERRIVMSRARGQDPSSDVPPQLKDRFSPEGKWPYGTHLKGESILIWSPNPDGRMDFSPVREFRTDDPSLAETMILRSYDPTNGMLSSGDLMEVVPLPKPEEIRF